jgi:hypothetical protein
MNVEKSKPSEQKFPFPLSVRQRSHLHRTPRKGPADPAGQVQVSASHDFHLIIAVTQGT